MMPEISLNILDIAENSVKAGASLVEITVSIDRISHRLTFFIRDNGCGMSAEKLEMVTDPFFTSRKTRKVGLGIPFLKLSAELTGGSFSITSEPGVGTEVTAVFCTDSIDCMPLGNLNDTIFSLVVMNETIHFVFTYEVDGQAFCLDTREIRDILGDDISYQDPEIAAFIREYLIENSQQIDAGM